MPKRSIAGIASLIFLQSLVFTSDVAAQNTLKDSRELLEKGIELYDKDDFKNALSYFIQVPEGDTNYAIAKYEIALSYLADSAFEKSKQVALEGMQLDNIDKRKMLYLAAHAYDYLGKSDSANYYYDSLMRMHPTDNIVYYEKSVVYFQKEDYNKAMSLLETALMMNPYHYRSHALLGNIYVRQGRLTEAYMSFLAALLFTNDVNIARGAILSLSAIARQSKEIAEYYDQRKEGYELFSEIDEIIYAKLALNQGYNIPSVMGEDQIVRVAYAMMDKLSYDKNSKNFAMQYYVPLFKDVYNKSMFDPLILLMFSNYGIDVVEQYAKKQKRDISEVRELVFPYWNRIVATRTIEYHKREKAPMQYSYDNNSNVYVVGNLSMEDGKVVFREGHTKLYSNYYLTAEGKFNNNGEKDGAWLYYHPSGNIRLTETYKNGVIQGEAREYYKNGFLKEVRKYNNAGEQTEELEYTNNGILSVKTTVLPDKTNEVILYHLNGNVKAVLKVEDKSLMDGKYKWYHSNGRIEQEVNISDGKKTGEYKEYYESGKLKEEGIYRKGDRDGIYTTYYENGKKETELNYKAGKADGVYTSYNEQGQVTEKTTFKDGKRNGADITFSKEREYYIIDYKNSQPVGYTFKGVDGKEIKEASAQLQSLKRYYADGSLQADLPLKNGDVHGQAKYYFNTGSLRQVINFENDLRQGTTIEYYKTGKKYIESEYVKNERTGPYKGYFGNGQLQAEGWLFDNKKEGVWRYYTVNGKLEREAFYLDDEPNGPSRHYNSDGKIIYMDYYDKGLIMRMEQYDNKGKIIHKLKFPLGTGKYYFIYPNGNISFEAQLKNGKYEGAYTSYYPDKTIREKGYYKNGNRDSLVLNYFPGGKEAFNGSFSNGNKNGRWIHHDFSGKLERDMYFVNGDEHGKDKMYQNGQLRAEYNMDYDYMEGNQIFYGEEEKIALVYHYDERNLIGYTYEGNDGKLLPLIPLKNGTGKVQTYYANGKKAFEASTVENLYDGKVITYFSNGNIAEEKNYVRTELNGAFKRYFPNGKPSYETTYKDNVINGQEKTYSENGKLLIHSNFVMGERHGVQLYYNSAGKGFKLTYEYGELMTIENL
ncbi:hypothetical protein CAP35_10615 [Chitinophagaceae bacterium IBVUCB1]|nr:hypothetical protein CAP35_10615 [Chitinophagaceae bacterium IBVUCB1]